MDERPVDTGEEVFCCGWLERGEVALHYTDAIGMKWCQTCWEAL